MQDVCIDTANFFADGKQLVGGFVVHFFFGNNGKVDVVLQTFVGKQLVCVRLQQRRVNAVVDKQRRLQQP